MYRYDRTFGLEKKSLVYFAKNLLNLFYGYPFIYCFENYRCVCFFVCSISNHIQKQGCTSNSVCVYFIEFKVNSMYGSLIEYCSRTKFSLVTNNNFVYWEIDR